MRPDEASQSEARPSAGTGRSWITCEPPPEPPRGRGSSLVHDPGGPPCRSRAPFHGAPSPASRRARRSRAIPHRCFAREPGPATIDRGAAAPSPRRLSVRSTWEQSDYCGPHCRAAGTTAKRSCQVERGAGNAVATGAIRNRRSASVGRIGPYRRSSRRSDLFFQIAMIAAAIMKQTVEQPNIAPKRRRFMLPNYSRVLGRSGARPRNPPTRAELAGIAPGNSSSLL